MRGIKAASIDEYLAALNDDQRKALTALRRIIRAAAPDAEECISYQMPAFKLNGLLVGFAAAARHCAFYPMSATTVQAFKLRLRDYETSKGTIRFQPDQPLSPTLVRSIVKARIAENRAR